LIQRYQKLKKWMLTRMCTGINKDVSVLQSTSGYENSLYGEVEIQLRTFITLALDRDEDRFSLRLLYSFGRSPLYHMWALRRCKWMEHSVKIKQFSGKGPCVLVRKCSYVSVGRSASSFRAEESLWNEEKPEFVLDKVALGEDWLSELRLSSVIAILPVLHTHSSITYAI
jgi:hypothetical protein